jgi:hypothetical protein
VEAVDEERFPLFKTAPYLDMEIGPGECLFIPRGHVINKFLHVITVFFLIAGRVSLYSSDM